MHIHSPIKQKDIFTRAIVLLFSPVKVFHYYTDGEDICDECRMPIALPWVYYSTITSIAYFLAGCAIGIGMSCMPFLKALTAVILMGIFHHIYSSVIFAVFPWEAYNPDIRSAKAWREDANKELAKKTRSIILGMLFGVFLYVALIME